MNILDGIKNFLQLVNENWTTILVIVGLTIGIYRKTRMFFDTTNDEKIEIAKKQISERMLKLVSDAEENYESWAKAGEIKRSEVISKIYEDYPILSGVIDQDELINWIDDQIDAALPTLRKLWSTKIGKAETADI